MSSFRQNTYYYLETILITIAYIAVGLYFHPQDPLFLSTAIPFLSVLLIVITLFYGLKRGFLSLAIVSVIFYYHYHDKFAILTLVHLFLVLLLGQFFHYWHKRYTKVEQEYAYTNTRLEELSHAFYTLKISHDTLEKNYALKPHSIRSSIRTLESLYFQEGSHYENFLHLIAQSFQAQGSLLAIKKKRGFTTVASLEKGKTLEIEDPLVQKAIQSQETSYVQGDDKQESLYLIVIPVKNQEDNIVALLAIDKMPFLDFNQNNIISVAILFSYFIDQVKLWGELKAQGALSVNDETLFSNQYHTMKTLSNNYDSTSSLVVFKSLDALEHQQLIHQLDTTLRALDTLQILKVKEVYIIKILVSFSDKEASMLMINKILTHHSLKNKDIHYMIFDIKDDALIERYIKEAL